MEELKSYLVVPGLSFTWETGTSLPFLDTEVHFHDKEVCFKPFSKRLNHYQYLPWASNHPLSVKRGLVKTELIRFSHISKKEHYFVQRREFLKRLLLLRGYPEIVLNPWMQQVTFGMRSKEERNLRSESRVLVKSEYNSIWEQVSLQDSWDETRANLGESRFGFLDPVLPVFPKQVVKSLKRTESLWDTVRKLNKEMLSADLKKSVDHTLRKVKRPRKVQCKD